MRIPAMAFSVNFIPNARIQTLFADYLSNREASVWFQGHESEQKEFELGTPQGGVLSPILFNVLMANIASYKFYGNSQEILYADDILIQCKSEEVMSKVIDEFQFLCISSGLVNNENKTKYQSGIVNGKEFWLNEVKLQKVISYKYLGMFISFHNNVKEQIAYVNNICTARLKPLEVLANRVNGVGVPVLRAVYLSTARSIIDYPAPVLVTFSEKDLRSLEVLQNKGMRIVLGCPRTTGIKIMKLELNIPSIIHRIRELTTISVVRLIRHGDTYLKSVVDNCRSDFARIFKINSYTKKLCNMLLDYNVVEFCVSVPKTVCLKPWLTENISVRIDKLDINKRDCCPYELRQMFIEKISQYLRENVVHMFCDGSVTGNRAGSGVVIREFFEYGISVEERISKRIADKSLGFTAELYAIYVGLNYALAKKKRMFGFNDC